MDWGSVSFQDVAVALKEVDWNQKPRPPVEFFASFSAPNKRSKWQSRLKCNVYYYRANYFVWFVVCFIVSFFRNPLAFAAVALLGFTSLLWNDSFAHSVSERVVRAAKKLHQPLAAAMRSPVSTTGDWCDDSLRTQLSCLKMHLIIPVVAVLYGTSVLVLYLTSAVRTISITLGVALGGIVVHGIFRTPNLKARLTNYHEEFRAVWRGYNDA